MPLFECSRCRAVENTALGAYWVNNRDGKPVLCSECDTGTWHGEFEKQTKEEAGYIRAKSGYLYTPESLAPGGYFYGLDEPEDPVRFSTEGTGP